MVHLLLVALAADLGTAAHAQLPLPFGPEPDFSERWQCGKDYVRSVERQLKAMEKLRSAGPKAIGQVCTLIDMGSAWLGGEFSDDVRTQLRELLGVDVDLDRIRTQCRMGQDNIERGLTTRVERLKAELIRCDDTV